MKLVQVESGQIVKWQLPKVGELQDGSSVSGYDILMKSKLELARQEGWLPLEDNPPIFDETTQYLVHDGYEILSDKVIVKYKIQDMIIVEEIPQEPSIDDYLLDLDFRISSIELGL